MLIGLSLFRVAMNRTQEIFLPKKALYHSATTRFYYFYVQLYFIAQNYKSNIYFYKVYSASALIRRIWMLCNKARIIQLQGQYLYYLLNSNKRTDTTNSCVLCNKANVYFINLQFYKIELVFVPNEVHTKPALIRKTTRVLGLEPRI